jgi:hypothetical protein
MNERLGGSNLSWTNIKLLSQNLTVNTEENHEKPVMIVGNPTEIRTECVPNANQNHYLFNWLARFFLYGSTALCWALTAFSGS